MRIFHFDDSGNKVSARDDRYFCLAGFSIDASDLPKLEMLRNSMWDVLPGLGLAGDELKFAHVGMD